MTDFDIRKLDGAQLMSHKQREDEDYWGRCWAVALGRHLQAEVCSIRPDEDPPDVDFHIEVRDGTVVTSWGEITSAYYDSTEAKWLWGPESRDDGGLYLEPDAVMATRASDLVERKRDKLRELGRHRGRGHLLVLLRCPLTSRSTREAAEESIRAVMMTEPNPAPDPFETVWLGYRLPITIRAEQEQPQYAFRDTPNGDSFNFLKCIWTNPTA